MISVFLMGFFAGRHCYSKHGAQYHEFKLQLRDAERLRLYVQLGMAERKMQSVSLKEVELACHRLELEAKESAERTARAEAERDTTCNEASMAKLEIEGDVNAQA